MAAAKNKFVVPALGVVILVLLGACGWLFMQHQGAAQRADRLEQAAAGLIEKAGLTDVNPASLKSPATMGETLDQLLAAVEARTAELAGAKESLATASAEALNAKTEAGALAQRVDALAAQAKTATDALAAKEAAEAAAQAEAAAAAKTLQDQVAKLTKDLEAAAQETKAQQDQVARLQSALTAAGLEAPTDAPPAEAAGAEAAGQVAAPAGEATPPPAGEEKAETPAADVQEAEEGGEAEPGPALMGTAGLSEMFKRVRYDGAKQQLEFTLVNDVKLNYADVPEHIYAGLQQAADMDVFYRFRVAGVFPSKPDDKQAIAELWRTTLKGGRVARDPVKFSP